jgi:hypothetical protein
MPAAWARTRARKICFATLTAIPTPERTADDWAKAAVSALERAKRAIREGCDAEAERHMSHAQYYLRRAEAAQRAES